MKKVLLLSMAGLATLTLSCGDEVSPPGTPFTPDVRISPRGAAGVHKAAPGTDGLFLRLSERIPGGFAGLYVGEDGKLHMWLTDPSQAPAAVAELQRFYAGTNREAQAADVVVENADFSWPALYAWYMDLLDEVWRHSEVVATDIDERANRIRIAVESRSAIQNIKAGIAHIPVPETAVEFDVRSRAAFFGSVQDRTRPVVGGIEIEVENEGYCTLTANVHTGLDDEAWGFLTAAHCTKYFGTMTSDDAYQDGNGSGNHIGVEVADPDFWTLSPCPSGSECRYSDAALFTYDDSVSREQGIIARTYLNDLTIDSSNPEWEIVDDDNGVYTDSSSYMFVGDAVYKVGRSTGMTKGYIEYACFTYEPREPPSANAKLVCQDEVWNEGTNYHIAQHMDSGAPVFAKTGSSSAV